MDTVSIAQFIRVDLPFYWWLLYWNTHSVCGLFFGKLHAKLEVWRVVLEVGSVRARLL